MKRSDACASRIAALIGLVVLAALGGCATFTSTTPPGVNPAADALFDTVSALDIAVFDAFNNCSSPEQLQKHAGYFAPDVEFYHDTGGVTWTRQDMLANTEKYVCGNFRRALVAGSLRVYPIKDYGAIAQGMHRFCQFKTGECEGLANFIVVWRDHGGQWQITRVLSFGHRPNK